MTRRLFVCTMRIVVIAVTDEDDGALIATTIELGR